MGGQFGKAGRSIAGTAGAIAGLAAFLSAVAAAGTNAANAITVDVPVVFKVSAAQYAATRLQCANLNGPAAPDRIGADGHRQVGQETSVVTTENLQIGLSRTVGEHLRR